MINFIRRLVRRVKRVCLDCGAVPVEGTLRCRECSLILVGDFDDTSAEPVEIIIDGPVYFEEDEDQHWCESCQKEHGFRCPNNRLH